MITSIDPTLIDPNPYQARSDISPESVQDLAADLQINGLQQRPKARRHPQHPDRVQLAFGHRRVAAWRLAFPGQPLDVEVDDLTDRQLFDFMIAETSQREDFTAIDKARSLKLYIETFDVTQAEAAQRYGLKSQSAVSNLLRLLDLPPEIQTRVATGQLPERFARSLITVARINPEAAVETAQAIAANEDDHERQDTLETAIDDVLRKKGKSLSDAPFDLKWDPKQTARIDDQDGPLPACQGCAFRARGNFAEYCTRPACFTAKRHAWHDKELARVHKATGIALAAKGEKLHDVPVPNYQVRESLQKALASKHASLRLALTSSWHNEQVTGSRDVGLKTTDPVALFKALGYRKPAERKEVDYNRLHRLARRRNELIGEALLRAAPSFAKIWPDNLTLLDILCREIGQGNLIPDSATLALKQAKRPADQIAALRTVLTLGILDSVLSPYLSWDKSDPLVARKPVEALAQKLKIKLPAKWDEPLRQPVEDPEAAPATPEPAAKKPTQKAAK